jgi:hypothetical protein
MGFLSKIKENFTHGGVKIELQAPASVSMQDAQLSANVTVTSTNDQVQINNVRVEIFAESRSQGFTSNSNASVSPTIQLVAQAENNEQFTLPPNQSKSVPLQIVMNAGAAIGAALPEGSGMAPVAHALQELQAVGQALGAGDQTYYIQATADVDGVMLDPSTRQPIQILKPGQMGGAINIKL